MNWYKEMMDDKNLEDAVQRVQQMEQYLDDLLAAFQEDMQKIWELEELQEKLEALSEYYSSSLWLEDYDRDCAGEFPQDLKRGVLAQDTLYNLFDELKFMSN